MTGVTSTTAVLPQLTGSQGQAGPITPGAAAPDPAGSAAGAAPAGGSPGVSGTGATQAAPAGALPDLSATMGPLRWLGPIMAVGGAALALSALSKGRIAPAGGLATGMKAPISKFALYGGVGTALSGLTMTALGFKASGVRQGQKVGREQGISELTAAVQQEMVPVMQQLATENQQLKQQLAGVAAGGVSGGTNNPNTGSGQGTGSGAGTGGSSGGSGAGVNAGGSGSVGGSSVGGTTLGSTAPEIPAAQWTPAAIIGQAVSLGEVKTPAQALLAEAGSYVVSQVVGSGEGYASLAEADAAVRGAMTTELDGVKNHRWLVIEHGGRFHPYVAIKDAGSAPMLPQANGALASWHALRAIEDSSLNVQWMSYSWNRDGASSIGAYAPATVATTIGGGADTPATTTTLSPSVADRAVMLIGRGVQLNDAALPTGVAAGGYLQLQQLVATSVAGFDTPQAAADAARLQRQADVSGNPWKRWVSVRMEDGRYYVFAASIVNKPVPDLGVAASPAHVFGPGFAQFFDGAAWRAQADV